MRLKASAHLEVHSVCVRLMPSCRPPPPSYEYFCESAACAHHVVAVAPPAIVCTVQFGILHPDQREQLPQSFEDGILGERCERAAHQLLSCPKLGQLRDLVSIEAL